MQSLVERLRKIVYGVPSDSAKRAQTIRDEIVEKVEEEAWDWAVVEERAQSSYNQLKSGELPDEGDDIQTAISRICRDYHSKGYNIEDIKKGVDGVQARASAKTHFDQNS